MYKRLLNIPKSRSFLLFGARGAGKSTLLEEYFKDDRPLWFDLRDFDLDTKLKRDPMALERECNAYKLKSKNKWVVIDEIQKNPALLDIVHRMIEKKYFRFALTGSSARKLKRGSANLLAGRATELHLFPLTHIELEHDFNLNFCLQWGSLPEVFDLDEADRKDYLRSYTNTYLREEILEEQVIRKVAPFSAFLEVAAQSSGKIINFSKIARDVHSDVVSVQSYFQILADTYLGVMLLPFHMSIRKRQRHNPKFYFFDIGIQRSLANQLNIPVVPENYAYGDLFEQFVILEILRLNSYFKMDWKFSYLRTKDDAEIDLIIDRPGKKRVALEIKSTMRIQPDHITNLKNLGKDLENCECICLSQDLREQVMDGVLCVNWKDGIKKIFEI